MVLLSWDPWICWGERNRPRHSNLWCFLRHWHGEVWRCGDRIPTGSLKCLAFFSIEVIPSNMTDSSNENPVQYILPIHSWNPSIGGFFENGGHWIHRWCLVACDLISFRDALAPSSRLSKNPSDYAEDEDSSLGDDDGWKFQLATCKTGENWSNFLSHGWLNPAGESCETQRRWSWKSSALKVTRPSHGRFPKL